MISSVSFKQPTSWVSSKSSGIMPCQCIGDLKIQVFVIFFLVFRGCLFYGPPGTGKTLVARALANECSQGERKVSFFMRKGADCLSKWVGESERQLRLLFDQVNQTQHQCISHDLYCWQSQRACCLWLLFSSLLSLCVSLSRVGEREEEQVPITEWVQYITNWRAS